MSYKPHFITVVTGCAKTNELENTRKIDQNNPTARKWLAKHLWWAICNEKMVTIIPFDLYQEYEK